jgi:hypothetical protein
LGRRSECALKRLFALIAAKLTGGLQELRGVPRDAQLVVTEDALAWSKIGRAAQQVAAPHAGERRDWNAPLVREPGEQPLEIAHRRHGAAVLAFRGEAADEGAHIVIGDLSGGLAVPWSDRARDVALAVVEIAPRLELAGTSATLLDHLVSGGQQRFGDGEAERLGGLAASARPFISATKPSSDRRATDSPHA